MTGRAVTGGRVALVGAAGHGLWHRRLVHRLPDLTLVAVSDPVPPPADGDAPLTGVQVFTDHTRMLAATEPDAVIVCTPPHTHLPIALDVLTAGRDLLLEKPPVAGLAEHDTLAAAAERADRLVQVNFQALGSAALDRLLDAVTTGRLGEVRTIGVAGTWWRPPSYWTRAPWAGRRTLDGRPVVDGALLNPFAHAVMQGLLIATGAGWGPALTTQIERYRAAPIEVEDTGCVRIGYADDRYLTVAVTLAATTFRAGDITVSGSDGRAVLEYPTDRLLLPGAEWADVPGRIDMLTNLLAHRADPAVPLRAPLAVTRDFTAVLAAVLAAPPPVPVSSRSLRPHDGGWAIDGVEAAVAAAAGGGRLFSESAFPWAVPAGAAPQPIPTEE